MFDEIRNLTPHPVKIIRDGRVVVIFESTGVARVTEEQVDLGSVDTLDLKNTLHDTFTSEPRWGEKIKIYHKCYGDTVNLPEPQEGTAYIVSTIVKNANPHRKDLLTPFCLVRDSNGCVIGCEGLSL